MPRRNSNPLKPRTRLRNSGRYAVVNAADNSVVETGTKEHCDAFARSWVGNLVVRPVNLIAR